jgi:hypothetical protein
LRGVNFFVVVVGLQNGQGFFERRAGDQDGPGPIVDDGAGQIDRRIGSGGDDFHGGIFVEGDMGVPVQLAFGGFDVGVEGAIGFRRELDDELRGQGGRNENYQEGRNDIHCRYCSYLLSSRRMFCRDSCMATSAGQMTSSLA